MEEKKSLLEAYRRERSTKHKQAVKRTVTQDAQFESSVLLTATFGETLRTTICADNGADANIMDKKLLTSLKNTKAYQHVETLPKPQLFNMAASTTSGEPSNLLCTQAVTVDTELHIRHGTTLKLRRLRWLVTDQKVPEPLLGRPILEALGLDTKRILSAAADKYAGCVDADALIKSSQRLGTGRVSRVSEDVFHSNDNDDDDVDDENEWCDLGEETDTEWENHLQARLTEAHEQGISPNGRLRLESLLRKYRSIIRVRLNGGEPARVPPLQLKLKEGAVPVRAKPRRYPPEKRIFLRRYVAELLRMGFVKPASKTEWVAEPLIVPKKPPALFRLTMDYRPINSATQKTAWPMPHIDAVLADVRGSTAFASIDFCSGY